MNEHNNGCIALGRYAMWTSEGNTNTKPDLNEAFFVKRELAPGDALLRVGPALVGRTAGRTAAGAAKRPDVYRRRGRARAPAPARVRRRPRLAADFVRRGVAESQFSFRLSHYPPIKADASQFGIAPHTDASSSRSWPRPKSRPPGSTPSGSWCDVPFVSDSFAVNSGDMMSRWTNGRFKSTPHRALPPDRPAPLRDPVLPGPASSTASSMPADLPGTRHAAEVSADHLRGLS